ncbi:hypothetical protein NPIL_691801 [Nephila pilipes]|uniref:Uncharacterized protein n=1 Tax=Nephila pilipes TaxID=299642 RepID=A0A8X6TS67_NEPPI|nr:hypothetical protein NPIL_691801 [Nephila pilipes]
MLHSQGSPALLIPGESPLKVQAFASAPPRRIQDEHKMTTTSLQLLVQNIHHGETPLKVAGNMSAECFKCAIVLGALNAEITLTEGEKEVNVPM